MPNHATRTLTTVSPVTPRVRALRWAVVIVWAAVIFGASSLHGSQVPGRFGPLAHFTEYAVLGVLVFRALRLDRRAVHSAGAAVLIASVYGISDELHQALVPGRMPDPADWAIDTAGAIIGVLVLLILARAGGRRR